MTVLLYLGIAFAGIFLLLIVIGAMLPRKVRVERSIEIQASAERVFPEITDYHNFILWSAWSKKDPNMNQEFNGAPGSIGASYSWSGNKAVRSGKMITTELIENKFMKQDLIFGMDTRHPHQASFALSEKNGKTTVKWAVEMDMGANPIKHIFGAMMDKIVGTDFSDGLTNLKQRVEQDV